MHEWLEYWREQFELSREGDAEFLRDCGNVLSFLFVLAFLVGFIKLVWSIL